MFDIVNRKLLKGGECVIHYSVLDAIPIMIFVLVTNIMSYWHGKSPHGWRIPGLAFTIVLGMIAQILVGFFPTFLK